MKGTVQVVIINPEGYVLGVSRKDNHEDFGLPGGSLEDYDETAEAGAIRETFEETGLMISGLQPIYLRSKNGRIGYTYLIERYEGEINFDFEKEPHVVKWTTFDKLIAGKFGQWNQEVYNSLVDFGVFVRLTDSDCGKCTECTCD